MRCDGSNQSSDKNKLFLGKVELTVAQEKLGPLRRWDGERIEGIDFSGTKILDG